MAEQVEVSDVSLFKKAMNEMVVKNDKSWNNTLDYYYAKRRYKEYTREEVENIITSGSVEA